MKAWTVSSLGAPLEVLAVTDKSLPPVGPGEMRLQVKAAALGLPDAMMCRGDYEFKPELPFTPGQEVCGIVAETGPGVSVRLGDRVMGVVSFFAGQGGFAEECMSLEGMVFPVPAGMSDCDAAAFSIAYQTAWIGLVCRGDIVAGSTLLVHGAAGGSGSAAVQLGRALGARVIAVAGGAAKATACRAYGADEVIDYTEKDFVVEVNRITGGRGVDLVYDPVGGNTFKRSVACLANAGRLLAVGFASGQWGQADTHELVLKNASAVGIYVGAYSPEQRSSINAKLVTLFDAGKIAPMVNKTISFDELPQALSDIEVSKVTGKLVLRPG